MKDILRSVAAKVAGGWQYAGAQFDFEAFALPGGSLIAVVLWLYSLVTVMLKRDRPRSMAIDGMSGAHLDAQTLPHDHQQHIFLSSCCARDRAHYA